jgi:hypothetical protein
MQTVQQSRRRPTEPSVPDIYALQNQARDRHAGMRVDDCARLQRRRVPKAFL